MQKEDLLENAITSCDTKNPLNYVIGSDKKKKKIFEKIHQNTLKLSHVVNYCDVTRGCELQIY